MSREKPAPHNERSHMLQLRPTTVKNNQLKITEKRKVGKVKVKSRKRRLEPPPGQPLVSNSAASQHQYSLSIPALPMVI